MTPQLKRFMDAQFNAAQQFLAGKGEELVGEIAEVFAAEITEELHRQKLFQTGEKIVLPAQPDLKDTVSRQIAFAWSLGCAVGAAGLPQEKEKGIPVTDPVSPRGTGR